MLLWWKLVAGLKDESLFRWRDLNRDSSELMILEDDNQRKVRS